MRGTPIGEDLADKKAERIGVEDSQVHAAADLLV